MARAAPFLGDNEGDDDEEDEEDMNCTGRAATGGDPGQANQTTSDTSIIYEAMNLLRNSDPIEYEDLIAELDERVGPISYLWSPVDGPCTPELLGRVLSHMGLVGATGCVRDAPILDETQQEYTARLLTMEDQVTCLVKVMSEVNRIDVSWDGQRDVVSVLGRLRERLQRLIHVLEHGMVVMQSIIAINALQSVTYTRSSSEKLNGYHDSFSGVGTFYLQPDNKDPFAALAFRLLRLFQRRGLRKKPGSDRLFEKHFIEVNGEKRYTYSYIPLEQDITSLIYMMVRKETDAGWPSVLRQKNVADLAAYCRICVDNELPDVIVNPLMFSTMDGVYDAGRDLFALYEDVRDVFPELASGETSSYRFLGVSFSKCYYYEGGAVEQDDASMQVSPMRGITTNRSDGGIEDIERDIEQQDRERVALSNGDDNENDNESIGESVMEDLIDVIERRPNGVRPERGSLTVNTGTHTPAETSHETPVDMNEAEMTPYDDSQEKHTRTPVSTPGRSARTPSDRGRDPTFPPDYDERVADHLGRPVIRYEDVLQQMPNFLQILRDQDYCPMAIKLFLAMLGRTLWKLGEKDGWQVWSLIEGASGVGKSTIIKLWTEIFHPSDVGVISPDAEQSGFGKSTWLHARLLVAPETRGDRFGLSPEMALNMMSGDSLSIPVKYGQPVVVQSWQVQAILLTNRLPASWLDDPAGARLRRFVVFPMPNQIKRRDPGLFARMMQFELGAVLRASVLAYLQAPRDKDLISSTRLPHVVQAGRNRLMRQSNPLIDYLMTAEFVRLDERRFLLGRGGGNDNIDNVDVMRTPLSEVRRQFKLFVRRYKRGARTGQGSEFDEDFPFSQLNLFVRHGDDGIEYLVGMEVAKDLDADTQY